LIEQHILKAYGSVKVYLHTVDWYRPEFLILGSAEPYGTAEVCQGFRKMEMLNGLIIFGRPKFVRTD
jgi:hypothetical protein